METKLLDSSDLNAGVFTVSNANSASSTWSTKTPQEILDDVNALLSACRENINAEWSTLANGGTPYNWNIEPPEKFDTTGAPDSYLAPYRCLLEQPSWWPGAMPDELLMPLSSFWFLMQPTLALLLHSRKTRRPSKFTRRLGK